MTNDKYVPSREDCVLRSVLERQANDRPDQTFLRTADGEIVTYKEFLAQVETLAAGIAGTGIRQDNMVAVWMPNGIIGIRLWFAINWLGAVFVPINTAYKGKLLQHVLNNCGASLMIAHGDLVQGISGLDIPNLQKIVVFGGAMPPPMEGIELLSGPELSDPGLKLPSLDRPIEPWDVQSIIYTSGTTGPSKGVISSYAHLFTMGSRDSLPMFSDADEILVCGPLFHASGLMPVYAMLIRGSTAILLPAFSTKTFWPVVRATGATGTILLGVMTNFLMKEEPHPDDRNHTLRSVIFVPMPEDWKDFAVRFGVTAYTCFNMSETAIPIVSSANPEAAGTCGKTRRGVEARVVDAYDREVPTMASGELILRADAPWTMNSGYLGNPEATAKAWRNGWFHTGDAFRTDADGNLFFVDRLKDSIRRRGENISSFEVEVEILLHPKIRECAVIAVASEESEDEILAVVAAREGELIDPVELHDFLSTRLAHFMLPRYIRVMDRLPRTPSEKVEKHRLRTEGLTSDAWDREIAGIRVRRTKIS